MSRHFTLRKVKAKYKNLGRILLLILGVILLLTGIFLLRSREKKSRFSNPPGTVGNTAGNLNNSGLFCEYDGTVYFSNSFDNGCLYTMTPDEGNIRYVSSASVQNLLAGGKYLYYFQTRTSGTGGIENLATHYGFNRTNLKGEHAIALSQDVVVTAQLINNYVYMVCVSPKGIAFRKVLGDGSKTTDLADYAINPSSVMDGLIYYNSLQDSHYLYTLNTETDVPREILEISMWYPIADGRYVYYMDVDHNYRLCRYSFEKEAVEVLTRDRVDCFNVGNGYIYYQKNSTDPQLICMRTDGTDPKAIATGNYTRINMTSQYVYFQDFESGLLYHSRIGSDTCQVFDKALEAVPEKK